jgi:hypothetical protein
MNLKRLLLALLAVFVFVWVTDFLIHGVWLKNDYAANMSLWRPEAEMQSHMGWLMLGQFLCSLAFVLLYAKGFAEKNCLKFAVLFGLFMGIFFEANTLVTYAVQPLPGSLAVKWFLANIAQTVLMGVIVFCTYKPKPDAAGGDGKKSG